MIYGSVAYCACGQEIWLEYLRDGKGWKARFSDQDGGEITHCPSCGAVLDEEELDSL